MTVSVNIESGTIVVKGLDEKASTPEYLTWDVRTKDFRCPAFRFEALHVWLNHQNYGINRPDLQLETLEIKTNVIESLRSYQSAALNQWQRGGSRGIVCLPTGAGKTRLACSAIAATRKHTLCIVPTRILLHQWHQEISNTLDIVAGKLGDGCHTIYPITVATFESAWRKMNRLSHMFSLIIVDEVHHFGDRQRDEVLEMCCAPLRLGLTATPPDNPVQMKILEDLVGPVVFKMSLSQLTGSWLAPVKFSKIEVCLNRHEQDEYEVLRKIFYCFIEKYSQSRKEQFDWKIFTRAAVQTSEGRCALRAWRLSRTISQWNSAKKLALHSLLLQFSQKKTIIFTANTSSTYEIAREYMIPAITSCISNAERKYILSEFSSGGFPAIVTCRVLNEGYDLPAAGVAIIVSGSASGREYIQRIGRILRPALNKEAWVVELITSNTIEESNAKKRHQAYANSASS